MLRSENKKELRRMAQALKPILQVGKNGVTESFLEELKKTLKKKKVVKVKFLGSFKEKNELKQTIRKICDNLDIELVSTVGGIATFHDSRAKKQ